MKRYQPRVLATMDGPNPARMLRALPAGCSPFMLDSSDSKGWSFLGWNPSVVHEGVLESPTETPGSDLSSQNPARILETLTQEEEWLLGDLPVGAWGGGWMTFLGFECSHGWERYPWVDRAPQNFPDFRFARYEQAIAWSPSGRLYVCSTADSPEAVKFVDRWLERASVLEDLPGVEHTLTSELPKEQFVHAVEMLRRMIGEGELFQANLSHPISIPLNGAVRDLYESLRARQPTSMSAYWENQSGHAMLSFSPERFLRVENQGLQTRPIKGTAPRGGSPVEDERLAQALQEDPKEVSELTMIVDMARNDLGRVAKPGAVRVLSDGAVESFETLFHRTATIEAEWEPRVGIGALLEATFPPASVTGAPKIRALQAISELESEARGPYCGALGIWQPGTQPRGDFSVLIRTAAWDGDHLRFRVGAGIVWDSVSEKEWAETWLKARFWGESQDVSIHGEGKFSDSKVPGILVLDGHRADWRDSVLSATIPGVERGEGVFETFLFEKGDKEPEWDLHEERLFRSVALIGFPVHGLSLVGAFQELEPYLGQGPWRVRYVLLKGHEGVIHRVWTAERPAPVPTEITIAPSRYTRDPNDPLHKAKTISRVLEQVARRDAQKRGAWEALLPTIDGDFAEATTANFFLWHKGVLRTPSADRGILLGTTRQSLLKAARAAGIAVDEETRITHRCIQEADEAYLTNAVVGVVPVKSILGLHESLPGAAGPFLPRLRAVYAGGGTKPDHADVSMKQP